MPAKILFSQEIGLPLVPNIGTASIHCAQSIQTWHSHDGFEMIFAMAGATVWEFQNDAPIELTGGHFLVIPPGLIHRGERSIRKPCTICGLEVNPECRNSERNTTFSKQDLHYINDRLTKSALSVIAFDRELTSLLHRLISAKRECESDQQNPLIKATLRTLACSIILETVRPTLSTPAAGPTTLVAAAKAYFQQHIHEPVRMSDLIKHMGFSRSYLFNIFKSVTGMTPNDYYVRIRIESAQKLLIESAKSITAIAMETGFSSSQYFSSVFRKNTGLTPLDYRQKSKQKAPR